MGIKIQYLISNQVGMPKIIISLQFWNRDNSLFWTDHSPPPNSYFQLQSILFQNFYWNVPPPGTRTASFSSRVKVGIWGRKPRVSEGKGGEDCLGASPCSAAPWATACACPGATATPRLGRVVRLLRPVPAMCSVDCGRLWLMGFQGMGGKPGQGW